jgi:hypothetical protein
MPAILVEPLFGSNAEHAAIIMSSEGRHLLAWCLAETVRRSLPEGGKVVLSAGHGTVPGKNGCAIYGYPQTSEHFEAVAVVRLAREYIEAITDTKMPVRKPVTEPVMDPTLDEDDPETPELVPTELHPEWAKSSVDYVQEQGLMSGYPDGLFHGDERVTRYELAVILRRLHSGD